MTTAAEIMTSAVITIKGSATVAEAVALMKDKGLRSLIVEPRYEGDPYGMISETDVVYKVAAFGHDPKQMRVYEIMTKPCVVIEPNLGVEYVARLLAQTKLHRVPVVQETLLGVVSSSDILNKSDFVEKPKRFFIEDELEVAREQARAVCVEQGATSRACAAAWDVVEELQAEAADQRRQRQAKVST